MRDYSDYMKTLDDEKRKAYMRLVDLEREDAPVVVRAAAVEDIIHCYYDRSAFAYRGKHPDFLTYISHFIKAGSLAHVCGDQVWAEVVERHAFRIKAIKKLRILPNSSFWISLKQMRFIRGNK